MKPKEEVVCNEFYQWCNTKTIAFNFNADNKVIWKYEDNKLDIEVIGDMTENAKLMIAEIKKMLGAHNKEKQ